MARRTSDSREEGRAPRPFLGWILLLVLGLGVGACSTVKSVFSPGGSTPDKNKPINSPFGVSEGFDNEEQEKMIFRSKRENGSVEVEVPQQTRGVTDFVLPVSPGMTSSSRQARSMDASDPDAEPKIDNSYLSHPPTLTDREIIHQLGQNSSVDDSKRASIEEGLGLAQSEDGNPEQDKSYLAQSDHVKQLYRATRYEAALIETDSMIKTYQTDPKLYEMRGTLLERLGHEDLALKSWTQALRFDPANASLRRFIERRQQRIATAVAVPEAVTRAPTEEAPVPARSPEAEPDDKIEDREPAVASSPGNAPGLTTSVETLTPVPMEEAVEAPTTSPTMIPQMKPSQSAAEEVTAAKPDKTLASQDKGETPGNTASAGAAPAPAAPASVPVTASPAPIAAAPAPEAPASAPVTATSAPIAAAPAPIAPASAPMAPASAPVTASPGPVAAAAPPSAPASTPVSASQPPIAAAAPVPAAPATAPGTANPAPLATTPAPMAHAPAPITPTASAPAPATASASAPSKPEARTPASKSDGVPSTDLGDEL